MKIKVSQLPDVIILAFTSLAALFILTGRFLLLQALSHFFFRGSWPFVAIGLSLWAVYSATKGHGRSIVWKEGSISRFGYIVAPIVILYFMFAPPIFLGGLIVIMWILIFELIISMKRAGFSF